MKDISRYIAPILNEGLIARGRRNSEESMVKDAIAGTLAGVLGNLKEDYITVYHEEGSDEPYYACIDVPRAMYDIVISSNDNLHKIPDKEIILCGPSLDQDLVIPRVALECSLMGKDAQKVNTLLGRTYIQSFTMDIGSSFDGVRVNMGVVKGLTGTMIINAMGSYKGSSFEPIKAKDCKISLGSIAHNNVYEINIFAHSDQEGIEILDPKRILSRCRVCCHLFDKGLWNEIYDAVNFGDSYSMKSAREALQEVVMPMMPQKFSRIKDIPYLTLDVYGGDDMGEFICMPKGKNIEVKRFGKSVELVIPDVL